MKDRFINVASRLARTVPPLVLKSADLRAQPSTTEQQQVRKGPGRPPRLCRYWCTGPSACQQQDGYASQSPAPPPPVTLDVLSLTAAATASRIASPSWHSNLQRAGLSAQAQQHADGVPDHATSGFGEGCAHRGHQHLRARPVVLPGRHPQGARRKLACHGLIKMSRGCRSGLWLTCAAKYREPATDAR